MDQDKQRILTELQSQIFSKLPQGFVIVNTSDGKIFYANPRFESMFGYSPGELEGKPVMILYPAADQDSKDLNSQVVALLKEGKDWQGETRNIKKDGTLFWCEASISSIEHPQLGPVAISIHTDISDRKRMEETLRDSEARYRILAETAHDMIFIIGRDDRVQYINTFAAKQFGTTPDKIIGKLRAELFPPDVAQQQAESLHQIFESGQPKYNDTVLKFGNKQVWASNWLEPLRNEAGEVTSVIGISRDITQRKEMEEALRESEEKYRSLIEMNPDGIAIESEDKIVFVNPSALKIHGDASAQEVLGKSIWDFIHPDSKDLVKARLQQMADTGLSVPPAEQKWIKINGEIIEVEVEATPIKYGGKYAVQFVFRDITQQKKAEAEMRAKTETLEKMNKLMIGRELKMIEMKKELEELRNQVSK